MINDSKTICVTDDDSVEGIIEKIKNAAEPEINLVAFSHASPVLSVINLKLFKRIAESIGKTLLISTNDLTVKILSEQAGVILNFSSNIGDYKIINKKQILMSSSNSEENYTPNYASKAPRRVDSMRRVDSVGFEKKTSFPASDFSRRDAFLSKKEYSEKKITEFSISGGTKKLVAVFLFLALAIAGVAVYVILPKADIIIIPKTQPLNANFEFILNKNIVSADKEAKEIPATVMLADAVKKSQFNATGKKEVSAKSTGIVTVYNECSTSPRILKPNNQIVSSDGKIFVTTAGITVPGMSIEDGVVAPGSIDVPVVAAKAGSDYNIDPGNFTFIALRGAACQKITAKSVVAFSGGATGFATVVSDADLKKAKEFLEDEAKKELVAQLNEKKPSDMVLIPDAISIESGELITNIKIDQVAAKFDASIKTSAIAFLFNDAYVKEIAKDIFSGGKDAGSYVVLDSYEINYPDLKILNVNKLKMTADVKGIAYRSIDTGKLKSGLTGKSKEELENYIKSSAPEIDNIQITLWPFWVKKIPAFERNIDITVMLDPVK